MSREDNSGASRLVAVFTIPAGVVRTPELWLINDTTVPKAALK
jgi:hypothetical protein